MYMHSLQFFPSFLVLNCSLKFQVWRFLITFSDVLGLWPFTMDEFVQAFHDYVSPLDLCAEFCKDLLLFFFFNLLILL